MRYYLAGGGSCGNLKKFWDMDLYLVDIKSRLYCLDGLKLKDINSLESFYYLKDNNNFNKFIPHFGSFLLDSGAFTFLKQKNSIDWDNYLNQYAEFINKYNINLFFELDIDPIVGLTKVEQMRNKLEQLTGKKPIPVWHKNRGKQYFIEMCKNYPYVALGGIALKEIPKNIFEPLFTWFVNTAHKYNSKIHGLGYTSLQGLKKYKFDSVDSTSWLQGNRGGFLFIFDPTKGDFNKIISPTQKRAKSTEVAIHNFKEWVKFSKYAKIYL